MCDIEFLMLFNIFKKRTGKQMQHWEFALLNAVAHKLPDRYSFLRDQISKEFILDCLPYDALGPGWKHLVLNQNMFESFKDESIDFKLTGIRIHEQNSASYKNIELDLSDGVLIGYNFGEGNLAFDIDKIDIHGLTEQRWNNPDLDKVKEILAPLEPEVDRLLEINDTFRIELDQGTFYVIKSLGDGNYLAIDNTAKVYSLIHDPFEIEQLFDGKDAFVEALVSGDFSISEYYEKKMR